MSIKCFYFNKAILLTTIYTYIKVQKTKNPKKFVYIMFDILKHNTK